MYLPTYTNASSTLSNFLSLSLSPPPSSPSPSHQDWFSSHLKQLVMELSKSGATVADGANMSTASSLHFSDDDTCNQERAPLDLTE